MLQHRFIDSVRRHPQRLAFVDCTTGREVSYQRALLGALIMARRFRRVERGRIGIMLPTTAGAALAVAGALMAGLTPVMINYSTGAAKNCLYAQQQCDFKVIVTARALLERIGCEPLPQMLFLEDVMGGLGKFEQALAFLKSRLPTAWLKRLCGRQDLDKPAVVLFTSGSEKEPKAVQLSQRNLLANIDSIGAILDLGQFERIMAVLPFFHVMGLNVNLWLPLCVGLTTITYSNPLEFKTVAALIKQHRPGILIGTPLFLEGYARQSRPGDFAGVQLVVVGADKCPDALRELYRSRHRLEVYEGYGATETSPVISVNRPGSNRPGSIGLPVPGVEVKIIHYETGAACRPGETGKIMVRGESVMQGYLNDIEETSLRLKSGWYDTGDLGCLDEDGYLWHQGRLRRFVKIGGEMVSLVSVEEALDAVTPPEVACCAVELPDSKRGSRIVAVTSAEVDRTETNRLLSERLPNIALPKLYVTVAEFPYMGSGKADFRSLTDIVRDLTEG